MPFGCAAGDVEGGPLTLIELARCDADAGLALPGNISGCRFDVDCVDGVEGSCEVPAPLVGGAFDTEGRPEPA